MIAAAKINKLKLFVSGLILSLALGIVDYDVLFLANYDYGDCENKENTELVVSKVSEIPNTKYNRFYLPQYKIDFQVNNRLLIYKRSLQLYNATIVQLFNSQNNKNIFCESSDFKYFISNSIYPADDHQHFLSGSFLI